jgi:hypothetical protein
LKKCGLKRDKVKQDAVYVRIDRSGRIISSPSRGTLDEAKEEYVTAERYQRFIAALASNGLQDSEQFRKLQEAVKVVYWQEYEAVTDSTTDFE